jgi:hypothetical protein
VNTIAFFLDWVQAIHQVQHKTLEKAKDQSGLLLITLFSDPAALAHHVGNWVPDLAPLRNVLALAQRVAPERVRAKEADRKQWDTSVALFVRYQSLNNQTTKESSISNQLRCLSFVGCSRFSLNRLQKKRLRIEDQEV